MTIKRIPHENIEIRPATTTHADYFRRPFALPYTLRQVVENGENRYTTEVPLFDTGRVFPTVLTLTSYQNWTTDRLTKFLEGMLSNGSIEYTHMRILILSQVVRPHLTPHDKYQIKLQAIAWVQDTTLPEESSHANSSGLDQQHYPTKAHEIAALLNDG